jgi:hypothetical protein
MLLLATGAGGGASSKAVPLEDDSVDDDRDTAASEHREDVSAASPSVVTVHSRHEGAPTISETVQWMESNSRSCCD